MILELASRPAPVAGGPGGDR
eukprot:COSAG02_NODE_15033_length_1210_cov_18.693969_1_plen_20_part_10